MQYRIVRFDILKTKQYKDQYVRGYQAGATRSQIDELMRRTNDGQFLNAGNLVSDDPIMHMASNVGSRVLLSGGWDAPRSFFVMVAEGISPLGLSEKYILTGYADGDITNSFNESLNQSATLYFNNALQLSASKMGDGQSVRWEVKDTNLILRPTEFDLDISQGRDRSPGGYVKGSTYVRPTDVMSNQFNCYLDQVNLSEAQTHYNIGLDSALVQSSLSEATTFSKQSNNIASKYLERCLTAMSEERAEDSMDARMAVESGSKWHNLQNHQYVHEDALSSHTLLMNILGATEWRRRGAIPVNAILNVFPELDDYNVKRIIDPQTLNNAVYNVEQWHGSDEATITAAAIAAAVPGIMAQCGILSVNFTITNTTAYHSDMPYHADIELNPHGGYDVTFIDPNLPEELLVRTFLNRIRAELLPQITKNNSQGIYANIRAELFCDISIQISHNGGTYESFLGPTFANGLYGPTISDDGDVLSLIGESLERIDMTIADRDQQQGFRPVNTAQPQYGYNPSPAADTSPGYNPPSHDINNDVNGNNAPYVNHDGKNSGLF